MTSEEIIPPKLETENAPPEAQPQPYAPQEYKRHSVFGLLIRNSSYIAIGVLLSIALLWIGVLFYSIGMGVNNPTPFFQLSLILYSLGMSILSVIFIALGIGRSDFPQWLRAALVIGAVIILTWGLLNMVPVIRMNL